MNNRIRDLATQASIWCNQNAKGAPVAWEWEDKFGELIVNECANIARFHTPETEELEYSHLIMDKIKQHFGVRG